MSGEATRSGALPATEDSTFDHDGLVELGRYLKQVGYEHVTVTPLTHEYNNARPGNEQARTLRDVLGWSRPFPPAAVPAGEFELMERAGILARAGDLWRSTVRWASLRDHLCAHSAYPTDEEDAVFFGPDTYRFARMIHDTLAVHPEFAARVKVAADIGCGSGAGALLLADACPAARIAAVDINPKALRLTAVNAELANADRVTVSHSDLLDDVEGAFDLIIANPPYMLDAQERTYRHGGGRLGEGLAQRIIETALHRLAPGGMLLLYTGVALVDGHDPLLSFLKRTLRDEDCRWAYEEMDPDVFSEELLKPAYAEAGIERIAAVTLTLTKLIQSAA